MHKIFQNGKIEAIDEKEKAYIINFERSKALKRISFDSNSLSPLNK